MDKSSKSCRIFAKPCGLSKFTTFLTSAIADSNLIASSTEPFSAKPIAPNAIPAAAPTVLMPSKASRSLFELPLAAVMLPLADDALLAARDSPVLALLAALAVPVKLALALLAAVDTPPTAPATLVVLDDKLVIAV